MSELTEILVGLSKVQKSLHPKFLYDEKGSEIFEKICTLDEYYITAAENEILKVNAKEISRLIGPGTIIIEPGSGNGEKIRKILSHLIKPVAYVPVEISKEILFKMSQNLQADFPHIDIIPIVSDFTKKIKLPVPIHSSVAKKIIFFSGSTIGNFDPNDALQFLKEAFQTIGAGGGLLIGVDTKKESGYFFEAYDDSKGVTANFNLNLLVRLNREAGANFDLDSFSHYAHYNEELGRVEMHLISLKDQMVKVNQTVFRFRQGESIHTENSYKYSIDEFIELCAHAKLKLIKNWQDRKKLFCVYYFERE